MIFDNIQKNQNYYLFFSLFKNYFQKISKSYELDTTVLKNLYLLSRRCDQFITTIGCTKQKNEKKSKIYDQISKELKKNIQNSIVVPYGSFSTKNYLFNSDIDICCYVPNLQYEDLNKLAIRVTEILDRIRDVKQIKIIPAEIPIVKASLNNIGIDISFTRPSGIITSYFIEIMNYHIGTNNLYKRSLILTQNWMLNEAHCLGSHNFMLSSYALRTMVAYIIFNYKITSPLHCLLTFLAFFKDFDFENNVISIFGIISVQQMKQEIFQNNKSIYQIYLELKKNRQLQNKQKPDKTEIYDSIIQLCGLQNLCRDQIIGYNMYQRLQQNFKQQVQNTKDLEQSSTKGFIYPIDTSIEKEDNEEIQSDGQSKQDQLYSYLVKKHQNNMENNKQISIKATLRQFTQSGKINAFYINDSKDFYLKYVNIMDPVFPSNNLGKSVNRPNMIRMKQCMKIMFDRLNDLLKTAQLRNINSQQMLKAFDSLWPCTQQLCHAEKTQLQELDLDIDIKQLRSNIDQVLLSMLGFK